MGNEPSKRTKDEIIRQQAVQIQQLQSQNVKIIGLLKEVAQHIEFENDEKRALTIEGKEYILKEKLGQGSFGIVFKAEHKDQVYAIKVIQMSESIKNEIEFIIKIRKDFTSKELPIIAIYGAEVIKDSLFYVMELAKTPLQTLFDKMEKESDPKLRQSVGVIVFFYVLKALLFLESIDVVHSDIKPDNFVIIDDSTNDWGFNVKLIDFGTVKQIDTKQSKLVTSSIGGTFLYLAPEAFKDVVHKKSDVWSLGIMLYQIIYNDFPAYAYQGEKGIALFANSSNEIELPDCKNELKMLLTIARKCLTKDLAKRSLPSELYADVKTETFCKKIIPNAFVSLSAVKVYKATVGRIQQNGKKCFICKSPLPSGHKYLRCNACFAGKCLDCLKPHPAGYKYHRCQDCFRNYRDRLRKN